jgi:DNA-binding CsgD family transcriptional regulator
MEQSILIRDTDVKITDILEMISQGLSYYQILLSDSRLTLSDIMVTAKLAKEFIDSVVTPVHTIVVDSSIEVIASGGKIQNLTKLREEYPQAFKPWTRGEEEQLVELFHKGRSLAEIARFLQRKRGAIRTRLKKLGLLRDDET